jgi:hypothetical protein
MSDWRSTEEWKQVQMPVVEELLGSNQTFGLDRADWPSWAQASTQMQRLWVFCPDDENAMGVPGSTAKVVARLLTERYDTKDDPRPYNYNFYLFAQSTDGRLFQSPPITTTDPRHHSTGPPQWLDLYGPPPL